jgi:hypothetical protein
MKKYFQAPWFFKDTIFVLIVTCLLLGTTFLGLEFLGVSSYFKETEFRSLYVLGVFLLQWILIVIPLIIFTKKKYKLKIKHFGINKIGVFETIKLVLTGYLLFLGITLIISLIIIYTNIKIPGYQIQEKILPLFGDGLINIIIAGIIIIVIAPILEEVFFRGFILRSMVNKTGIVAGSLISAGIFAVFHMQWGSIIPIFILGLIINSLVIKKKSIIPAIFFHIFNNAISFTIELLILKNIILFEELI